MTQVGWHAPAGTPILVVPEDATPEDLIASERFESPLHR